MRELHVQVSTEREDAVAATLETHDIDYTSITDGDEVHVFVPLPTPAVSMVLDDLREAGVDTDSYTVLRKTEFTRTPHIVDLQERYAASVRKLSTQELHGKIREIQWPYQLYYLGTLLSVIAATAGLLLDQPSLLIGAMIIAPQASSALAAPAGLLLSDWDLLTTSVREQALSLGLAVVGSAAFAWFLRTSGFVPADLAVTRIDLVSLRLAPTFLSTVGAIIAGVVGAFGYTTEQSTSLVGVMIAAALIPAAAAVGLAITWAAPVFGFGALLLLLVNVLAINVGAFLTLVGMGYQPAWRTNDRSLRRSVPSGRRLVVFGVLGCILLATLGTGFYTVSNVGFTRQANQAVEATLDQPKYEALSVSSVQVGYGGQPVVGAPTPVTVGLIRTTDRRYPRLATRIERRVEARTDRDVRTTVEFTDSQVANPSTEASAGRVRPLGGARELDLGGGRTDSAGELGRHGEGEANRVRWSVVRRPSRSPVHHRGRPGGASLPGCDSCAPV